MWDGEICRWVHYCNKNRTNTVTSSKVTIYFFQSLSNPHQNSWSRVNNARKEPGGFGRTRERCPSRTGAIRSNSYLERGARCVATTDIHTKSVSVTRSLWDASTRSAEVRGYTRSTPALSCTNCAPNADFADTPNITTAGKRQYVKMEFFYYQNKVVHVVTYVACYVIDPITFHAITFELKSCTDT